MPYIGGTEVPSLSVPQGDGTTAVVLTITKPDLTSSTVTPTTADGGLTWTAAPILYDQADSWVLLWTVTGAGANVLPRAVFVQPLPPAGGPSWRPSLSDVAKYVPTRTLVLDRSNGGNTPVRTFDESTTPTGRDVDALITDGCNWVQTATGPVGVTPSGAIVTASATLYGTARAAAAIYAAAAVERGYPQRDSDESIANDLLALASSMRADLVRANAAAVGGDPSNPVASLLPIYQFPPPSRWGDLDFN